MAKKLKLEELKHGMRVRCEIDDVKIKDAKISIGSSDNNTDIYICHNNDDAGTNFSDAKTKFGYKHTYFIADPDLDHDDTHIDEYNITLAKKDINDISTYEVGDILVDTNGSECKVLAVCGDIVCLSIDGSFKKISGWYFPDFLVERCYKFKDQPEEDIVEEMTVAEVCKELKREIKIVKDK